MPRPKKFQWEKITITVSREIATWLRMESASIKMEMGEVADYWLRSGKYETSGSSRNDLDTKGVPVLTSNDILECARKNTRQHLGLAFVPDMVVDLLRVASLEDIHTAMLQAVKDRMVEFRPESGMGRLSTLELRLCPPGQNKTVLSWAKII